MNTVKRLLVSLAVLFTLGILTGAVFTPQADALDVPRMTLNELKNKLDKKADIIVVDVRSKYSFVQEHIKGAISIPLGEVEERYKELLPKDKEIVFY